MTEVEFHTGVADPLGFACRLLRKAYRKQARLVVIGPNAMLAALDQALWTFADRDFIPHLSVRSSPPPSAAARTPIWLLDERVPLNDLPAGAPPVLVNLGAAAPSDPSRFERIIEVLPADAEQQQPGRERWRGYKAGGLNVVHHPAPAGSP